MPKKGRRGYRVGNAGAVHIIRHGLVYVIDSRDGLSALRYTGPHMKQVGRIRFPEGNSNLGDAVRLAQRAG
jgi:hypothetical protein